VEVACKQRASTVVFAWSSLGLRLVFAGVSLGPLGFSASGPVHSHCAPRAPHTTAPHIIEKLSHPKWLRRIRCVLLRRGLFRAFGLRILDFGFSSDFGFRFSDFALSGLSIFVVSDAKRGFNPVKQKPVTELSLHNQSEYMKRREFLTKTVAASTLAGLGTASLTASAAQRSGAGGREYYELTVYRLKARADHALLDAYVEKAAIPALNRLGVKPVGVFTEIDLKDGPALYLLGTYPSLEVFATATARLSADAEYQKAGAEYLNSPKTNPAFERIDSWLMLAFAGLPKLDLPAYCCERKPRVFEIRTYESYSELKAVKKVEMFNAGEIDLMRQVGLGPIFS